MRLGIMHSRCGTNKGVVSNSKEIEVYDVENNLIRSFGSVGELERRSEKCLGIKIPAIKIRLHCKNEKLYEGKYYIREKENFVF